MPKTVDGGKSSTYSVNRPLRCHVWYSQSHAILSVPSRKHIANAFCTTSPSSHFRLISPPLHLDHVHSRQSRPPEDIWLSDLAASGDSWARPTQNPRRLPWPPPASGRPDVSDGDVKNRETPVCAQIPNCQPWTDAAWRLYRVWSGLVACRAMRRVCAVCWQSQHGPYPMSIWRSSLALVCIL